MMVQSASGTGLQTHNVLAEAPRPEDAPPAPEWLEHAVVKTDAIVKSDRAPKPVGPYPHARRVGDFLFLSGIGPRHPRTGEIPPDIESQTRACIENIRVILEDAGSSLDKVLDVTVYLTDMKRDFDRFNKVYGEYFEQVQPTRTTVGVDSLPTPIDIELKVIAKAGPGG